MIKGVLEAFWETGTEGVIWSLEDEHNKGYDSLHCLQNGDYLEIYNEDGTTCWQGEIALEYERNYRPYPMNPQYGQQAVLGMWVRGLQKDVEPEVWAKMFFDKKPAAFKRGKKGD